MTIFNTDFNGFEWHATPDHYDGPNDDGTPSTHIGSGKTEQEAIDDLRDRLGECRLCGESLEGLDKEGDDTTCWWCLHPECEDGTPCVDCYSDAIDKAMDSMDMER